MENLLQIGFEELNEAITVRDSFQDTFLIVDVDGKHSTITEHEEVERETPMRLEALMMFLVQEGTSEMLLDYKKYTLQPNDFVIITPTHRLQMSALSDEFKGKLIVISREFIDECNIQHRTPSAGNYMLVKKSPLASMTVDEAEIINDYIELLRKKVRETDHAFHKEVMQNAFLGFLLEMGNIFMKKYKGMPKPTLTRKEELFDQFLKLLFQYGKEQHVVSFYADKLFITPQYLSLVLKDLSGKSANKWIDDALIAEAKILLKAPQVTIQQVADLLHFSDQSTFGKFFKKHVGISPMEYRKS